MSSSSARAMSIRCSCPPLSWCGYLSRTSPGFRLTASSDFSSLSFHAEEVSPGKYSLRSIVKTRDALKIGLYELNGSWKTP